VTAHGLQVRGLPEHLDALLPELGGRAACAGMAPLFDDELPNETVEERQARHHRAIVTCTICPVRPACTAARVELARDAHGIWAGVSSGGHHTTFRAGEVA
jgi:WhiB family redox-sensing transcriptional regulator